MKIGVFLVLFRQRTFEDALDFVKQAGCGRSRSAAADMLGRSLQACRAAQDATARKAFHEAVTSRDLEISSLSCHGNPLHPDESIGRVHDTVFRDTIRLAGELGIKTVVNFSGCPGDSDQAKHPNWVTCPWPPDFTKVIEWQWTEKVAPYWTEMAAFARQHGVRVAIELHPGFVVYNTESYLRLREIGGETLGVNFDPSHLFWQGMDPLVCVRELGATFARSYEGHVAGPTEHSAGTACWTPNLISNERAVLDLPHRGIRAWSGILAGDDERVSTGWLRWCALD